jgi:cytochrome c oxidase subunit 4
MSEHIVSKKIYFLIFGALLFGTGLTVMMAFVDLDERFFGGANAVTALTIAVVKATLVILYFMHVRYSSRLTWLIVSTGVLWLAIMFIFTFSDYATRTETYTAPLGAVVGHTKAEP